MRVLVVRAEAEGRETAARLAASGHEAVLAPILHVAPTGRAPPDGAFDAVLVTSRNAVPFLAARRARFAATPVYAVGPRTAEALRRAGFEAAGVAQGDAVSLAGLATSRMPEGARLLHVAGRDRRPELEAVLGAAGHELTVWEAYAAEARTALPDAARRALAAGTFDAILHYSPRSAALLRRLAEEAGLAEAMAGPAHLCLSANVAAALGSGMRIRVAAGPSEDALLALLGP